MDTAKPWSEWSDDELAAEAQLGRRGAGAIVESMRRLREALLAEQRSAARLSYAMFILAIIAIGWAVVQVVVALSK